MTDLHISAVILRTLSYNPRNTGLFLLKGKGTFLSYDIAVIQWITSCRKNPMTHTLVRRCSANDNVCVNNVFSYLNEVHFEGDKIPF